MGHYVHWQISWGDGEPKEVCSIAERHKLELKENAPIEIEWFLRDVASGKAHFGGNKGDFWGWGTVSNYTDTEMLLPYLKKFFTELYEREIIHYFDKVIIFQEDEQSFNVEIYQLSWKDKKIKIDKHESGFKWCWGQF